MDEVTELDILIYAANYLESAIRIDEQLLKDNMSEEFNGISKKILIMHKEHYQQVNYKILSFDYSKN